MKKIYLLINVGEEKILRVNISDCEEYYMLDIGAYDDGNEIVYTEDVFQKEDLKKLRDAIDFMINN
ncbi:hypothetical protein CAI16_05230 [Virgibacillus dokdonensis]|uniref:Uncharacterized protein n=1 Tax=Virgibacillus dokdonensis TaxID=302167 RepID=A0A3E0WW20_9BACI|nr:hypothetical protein [Virgibacillus dokdonensis]RFA36196.1 hypothetical protein CAI16_05230 [Virgibacillus dokdonensis]